MPKEFRIKPSPLKNKPYRCEMTVELLPLPPGWKPDPSVLYEARRLLELEVMRSWNPLLKRNPL